MSIRHLDFLFKPSSVAVVGASDRPGSVGSVVMRNLLEGGFSGPVWPVNPKHAEVCTRQSYRDIAALPGIPDLTVICTPAPTVPGLIAQLGEKGGKAAVVLSAGMQAQENGVSLASLMLQAAKPHLLRILGPNCVGLLVPTIGLNASFAHLMPKPGKLAFISQSGALTTALLDWAAARNIGFSHFVSLGDGADVDFGDTLDYLASDPDTHAILMYMESVTSARKFMSAARAAARNKPVLLVKAGRAPAGAKAAASHTGALAGSDDVFDAAIRRAGMLRVANLNELFSAAETLARARPLRHERLTIVTNGGGAGVLAADALALQGGTLVDLSKETLAALDGVLPATWSHGNPIDIIGDAPIQRYASTLEVLLKAPETDAILFMHAPTAIVPSQDIAAACSPLLAASRRTVLTSWLGDGAVAQARQRCEDEGLPTYETPEEAVSAFMQMVNYRRNQAALLETPSAIPGQWSGNAQKARLVLERAAAANRTLLSEVEAKEVLAAYGIPVVTTRLACTPDEAAQTAQDIGFPVALKIVSPDISHKSDVGGVALDLRDVDAVRLAARDMLTRVKEKLPQAQITGFSVQTMVNKPRAHELILGASTDPVFGPAILFGHGGTAVEVIRDRAIALPPLNATLAKDMVSRTRVAQLLAGYRDRPAIDHDALYLTLIKLSQMICHLGEIGEIDINPLLADENGVVALDARIKLSGQVGDGRARLAIRPYPSELERCTASADGRSILTRPIRPEDEPALKRFYDNAPAEDLRLRFFARRNHISHTELARYSQIDYDREMSFVAFDPMEESMDTLLGYACALADPDNQQAEFAVQVSSHVKRQGLGRLLMNRLIDYLQDRGVGLMTGSCMSGNDAMLTLARELGFTIEREGSLMKLTLALAPADKPKA